MLLTRGGDGESGDLEGALEVVLALRASALRFYGGFWALPAGAVDAADGAADGTVDDAALRRCALRETFEEVGVLPEPLHGALAAGERERLRAALLAGDGARAFRALVDGVPRALDALVPIGRFTTPPFGPLRFATTFYRAALPAGAQPRAEGDEIVEARLVVPREALAAWRRGELRLVPPLLRMLELLEHGALDELHAGAARAARALDAGALDPACNAPGLRVVALRTPTLPPATTTNCWLVGERDVWLVDPATPYADEQERFFALLDRWVADGRRLAGILVTHHHHDHVGAVVATSRRYELAVSAHALTLERLPSGFRAGRALADGDAIDLGRAPDGRDGWTLRALFTPGHDRGHLAFVDERYGAALVGDLLSTVSTIVIDPPEGHLATYLASLRRLLDEPIELLCPAHGPVSAGARKLVRNYLAHRAMREGALVRALAAGARAPDELVADVYADTPVELHGLARRSLAAGLEKLAEEGRARDDGGRWSLVGPGSGERA